MPQRSWRARRRAAFGYRPLPRAPCGRWPISTSIRNNAAAPPSGSPRSSSGADRRLRRALAQQVFLLAGQDQFILLVVHGDAERHDSGGMLWRQRGDDEARIERIAGIDRLQETGRLLDKGNQRV